MEMDLDALLLQESENESDVETTTDATRSPSPPVSVASPSRPESPCSVALPPLARPPRRRNEKRRVRHRESMARYRQEQRARVDALTTQQTALHRILQQVLAHNKPVLGVAEHRPALRQLQARFTELVRERERLETEQHQLSTNVVGHTQRFAALQIMLDHMRTTVGNNGGDDGEIARRLRQLMLPDTQGHTELVEQAVDGGTDSTGYWLEFLPHEPRLFYEHESDSSSAAIIRAGLEAIQQAHDALSDPTRRRLVASCLGWHSEQSRELDPTTGRPLLQMRLTKRIPYARTTLQELQDKTWVFLNSPELIARVNNGAVTAHVAQQLGDDTIILLRNSPDKFGHKRFRYFSLNARMWSTVDGSARVLMLVLDKTARLERPLEEDETRPPLRWMKHGGSCLRFAHVRGTVEIEYTGFIESLSDEHAAHLMVANCAALLRWEHLVVPPRLLV